MPASRSFKQATSASLLGAIVGLAVGVFIWIALLLVSPLVVVEARTEGKGSHIIEIAWLFLGIPLSIIAGALWPHTVGRVFNRRGGAGPG